MKPKNVVLMGVAIVCGLIAAFLVSLATATPKGPEMVPVLVAKEDLRQGKVLEKIPELFEQKMYPKEAVPLNAITDPKQLEGMQALRPLDKGAIPTQTSIGKYDGLGKRLPPGYRAFTIRVAMDSAVAGFILPGAKVDLLGNLKTQGGKRVISKIFMQDMEVLAVNSVDVPADKERTIASPSVVTLAVTPKQAERLSAVVKDSEVRLILRKPDDSGRVKTPGVIDPNDEEKAEGEEPDVDVYVAVKNIPANTPVDDKSIDEMLEIKRLPKKAIPPTALSKDERDRILKAKGIYNLLVAGQVLTGENLIPAVKITEPEKATEQPKQHVLRIRNGKDPVIEVVFAGTEGKILAPDQAGANVPGSDGK